MSELSVPLRPGRLKRGHPCPSSPPPIPSSPIVFSYSSHSSSSSSSSTPCRQPERRPGWGADVQGLSLRLGTPCQLGALSPSSPLHPHPTHPQPFPFCSCKQGIFCPLLSSSRSQPRPYRATFPPPHPLATIPTLSLRTSRVEVIGVRASWQEPKPLVQTYFLEGWGGVMIFALS